uniref:Uncharacterized protein n=1 Tax=Rhizophora mucronata TaxID=61149 RepID=A0A2P2LBY5_RHIMU
MFPIDFVAFLCRGKVGLLFFVFLAPFNSTVQ